jgi:hypothetical protein
MFQRAAALCAAAPAKPGAVIGDNGSVRSKQFMQASPCQRSACDTGFEYNCRAATALKYVNVDAIHVDDTSGRRISNLIATLSRSLIPKPRKEQQTGQGKKDAERQHAGRSQCSVRTCRVR